MVLAKNHQNCISCLSDYCTCIVVGHDVMNVFCGQLRHSDVHSPHTNIFVYSRYGVDLIYQPLRRVFQVLNNHFYNYGTIYDVRLYLAFFTLSFNLIDLCMPTAGAYCQRGAVGPRPMVGLLYEVGISDCSLVLIYYLYINLDK